jgi:inosine-uridine nucleoside N-ribohydrolase
MFAMELVMLPEIVKVTQLVYDNRFHKKVAESCHKSKALDLLYRGMEAYLAKGKDKKFHDPLAAAVAVDESICEYREVQLKYDGKAGGWRSDLVTSSNTFITIAVSMDKFAQVLCS